jgi:hypothetical protein
MWSPRLIDPPFGVPSRQEVATCERPAEPTEAQRPCSDGIGLPTRKRPASNVEPEAARNRGARDESTLTLRGDVSAEPREIAIVTYAG